MIMLIIRNFFFQIMKFKKKKLPQSEIFTII